MLPTNRVHINVVQDLIFLDRTNGNVFLLHNGQEMILLVNVRIPSFSLLKPITVKLLKLSSCLFVFNRKTSLFIMLSKLKILLLHEKTTKLI